VSVRGLAAFGIVAGVLAACASLANLDVQYTGSTADAGGDAAAQKNGLADAAQEPAKTPSDGPDTGGPPVSSSPLTPCDGGVGTAGGCDQSQGFGCCLSPSGSKCVSLGELATACSGSVFIGCSQSDPELGACCWRDVGNVRQANLAGDCDGGTIACLGNNDCPEGIACATKECGPPGNSFRIGQCGSAAPDCP
jgi:hypothetical protein